MCWWKWEWEWEWEWWNRVGVVDMLGVVEILEVVVVEKLADG
jgi:hypothetical protein